LAAARAEAARGGPFDVVDTWLWGAEATRYSQRHNGELGPLLVRLSSPDFEIREQHGFEARPDLDALDQRCLTAAATVAAISQQNLDFVAERFDFDPGKVVLTPLGVPVAPDDDPPPSSARDPNELLFVGRLEGRKGVDDLLLALDLVLSVHPEVTLTLAGSATGTTDAGESFESHLSTRVAPSTRERIRVVGRLSDDDLRSALRRVAIAVFPSRYESFGLVVLEAMVHGTPVVATTAGGIPEVAGEAALLVPPRSPDALAQALVSLIDDPQLRVSLGDAGAARVRAAFTTEHMLASTLAAYRRTCAHNRERPTTHPFRRRGGT
jgi:glycosyltransferase involved in cell wall biosynthesis